MAAYYFDCLCINTAQPFNSNGVSKFNINAVNTITEKRFLSSTPISIPSEAIIKAISARAQCPTPIVKASAQVKSLSFART